MTEPIAPAASPVLPGPATLAPGGGPAPALRRAILVHLRRTGPSAPDAIAAALGASRSGVAQQLRALDTAGLVTRTAVRHGVGRPRHLYDVTPDAQDLFPSNYDGLATGLLAARSGADLEVAQRLLREAAARAGVSAALVARVLVLVHRGWPSP